MVIGDAVHIWYFGEDIGEHHQAVRPVYFADEDHDSMGDTSMIVTIDGLSDLAQVPESQRSMAEAAFSMWRASRELQVGLAQSKAADLMSAFTDRDPLPASFAWDCDKGTIACP